MEILINVQDFLWAGLLQPLSEENNDNCGTGILVFRGQHNTQHWVYQLAGGVAKGLGTHIFI